MNRMLRWITLIGACIALAACARIDAEPEGAARTFTSSGKARAPVSLRHVAPRAPRPGEVFQLELEITPDSELDALSVSVSAGQGLALSAPATDPFVYDALREPRVNLQVLPLEAGLAYVNVIATATQEGRRSVRSFALPFEIGGTIQRKRDEAVSPSTPADRDEVIRLPAEQRIGKTASL